MSADFQTTAYELARSAIQSARRDASSKLTTKGDKKGDKGEVRIAYRSLEQLDEIVRRLSKS